MSEVTRPSHGAFSRVSSVSVSAARTNGSRSTRGLASPARDLDPKRNLRPSNSRRVVIITCIALISIAHLLPTAVGAVVTLLALGGGFALWAAEKPSVKRGYWPVVFAAAIIIFWAIGLLNPNVPNVELGIEGFRKSVLAVAGLAWGCAILERDRRWIERAVIIILNVLMAVSLVSFLWFPSLVVVSTDAGMYTSLFQGQARLQGAFSGPFHVAIAALVLIGWAIVRYPTDRPMAGISLALGAIGGYLCLVRTFYPALALMLLVFVIVAPNVATGLRRAFVIAGAGACLLFATLLFPTLGALGDIAGTIDVQNDDRFTNRFRRYTTALELFQNSPVFGWGPGSAGDTLKFPSGHEHVNAHNIILKLIVEGGFVGILLWTAMIVAVFMCTRRTNPMTQVAALSLAGLFGVGITVSAIDALPVSFLVFVICGLACEGRSNACAIGKMPVVKGRALPSN